MRKQRVWVRWLGVAVLAGTLGGFGGIRPAAWGLDGHLMVGRAAAEAVPREMPSFFRNSVDQLSWLNAEPDRWKDRAERDLDENLYRSFSPGHYINLESVPDGVLAAEHRLAYFESLYQAGVDHQPGFLPFTILELTQRLRVGFRRWRSADGPERAWIEQRIINDAGILGHYVADGSNPLHTTIHYNGWVGDTSLGYASDDAMHARFESRYVRGQITIEDVLPSVETEARTVPDLRLAVWQYIEDSNALVERVYQIDREARFDERTTAPANKAFIVDRLAAGATMLRDLWWTAWVTSAP
ncbi:MAG: hypothetical protein V3T16_02125 [Gemmatimonadales bacterium]